MFNTDPTLCPSKMGPQAPTANHRPPSATATASAHVQTNKFFPREMPDPAKVKKQQGSTPSKKTMEDDQDDLPLLVGEEARIDATNAADAGTTASDAPSTPLPTAPTVTGKVMIEEVEDDGDVESASSHLSYPLFLDIEKYLFSQMKK